MAPFTIDARRGNSFRSYHGRTQISEVAPSVALGRRPRRKRDHCHWAIFENGGLNRVQDCAKLLTWNKHSESTVSIMVVPGGPGGMVVDKDVPASANP